MNKAKKIIRSIYRRSKWSYLQFRYHAELNDFITINPDEITYGQLPESQFPAKSFLGKYEPGDWDLQVLPVEEHLLYVSYMGHFCKGEPWSDTPIYRFAAELIESGVPYRGEYHNLKELDQRLMKCDKLFSLIESEGYKSNKQLYQEGKVDNVLDLLDEVTVNIARDGSVILNDGWHRFITARILGVTDMPVRVCARHVNGNI